MRFSIIIPSYNYAHFLPRALDSCLAQSGDDWEIIVVDDGSTDDTAAVMARYTAQPAARVRYLTQINQGPAAARNHGARVAVGHYLLFLDADDALLPDALAQFREALQRQPMLEFVFGGFVMADTATKPSSRRSMPRPLSADNNRNFTHFLRKRLGDIATGAALFHHRIFTELSFPEQLRNNEDLVLMAQVLARYRCASIPLPVMVKHRHASSLRHDIASIQRTGIHVVDALFDPAKLPAPLLALREEFLSRVYLSRFRSLYLHGRDSEARRMYWLAIRHTPRFVFLLSYLRKYLRLRLRAVWPLR